MGAGRNGGFGGDSGGIIGGELGAAIGNLVRAADLAPLVVINQVAPIYVSFAIPESNPAFAICTCRTPPQA